MIRENIEQSKIPLPEKNKRYLDLLIRLFAIDNDIDTRVDIVKLIEKYKKKGYDTKKYEIEFAYSFMRYD